MIPTKEDKSERRIVGAFMGVGCLVMIGYALVWGVIIWAIVMLVNHFT